MIRTLFLCITALAICNANASTSVYGPSRYDKCFVKAGEEYGIDPMLLKSIGIQESSLNPRAINTKSVRYDDISLMQISGWWLNKPYFVANNLTRTALLNDGCLSIRTGAWILAGNFALNGVNWQSVGAYNAGFSPETAQARRVYIGYIQNHLARLKGRTDNVIIAQVSDKLLSLPVSELRETFEGGARNYRFESQLRSFSFDIVRQRDLGAPGKLVGNF
ncbi:hypothetical protein EHW64_17965 [Erwinia psidii]|uniref:lytic transglycosylase domain-containing protein n=1 Tax=Erwinia psidii TaxID=69224 RepID=UPI00226B1F62|nr:lytic transglycosylase domain-containing protein [Erwinia psidii]MCX8959323.1 hypothetical protein [Erwinia psidii]MCX8962950.1 hypothetical protein [Erwinia psidii]